MAFFVRLLANYAGLIYLVCVVGVVLYLREIIGARLALRHALYSLEREAANSRLVRGVLMIGVFAAIALGTYFIGSYVAPNLPADLPAGTPTAPFILTSATPTPTFQPSPTRTPRPTLTPTGAAPIASPTVPVPTQTTPTPSAPLPAAACPDPNVQLVAPAAGQTFNGPIQLRGTADTTNFAFYKFTIQGPGTDNIAKTAGEVVREPRHDAVLGDIDPAGLMGQPGTYIISLVVVDNTGNEAPHCAVPVIIQP